MQLERKLKVQLKRELKRKQKFDEIETIKKQKLTLQKNELFIVGGLWKGNFRSR